MTKRIISALVMLALSISLFACGDSVTFTCLDINLTLPNGYFETDAGEGANMLLTNNESTVSIKRLSIVDAEKQGISGSYSAKQFAEFFLINNELGGMLASNGDVPYYSYYDTTGTVELFCISAFYRTPYAYFIIIFATSSDREDAARDEFFDVMSSVTYNIVN